MKNNTNQKKGVEQDSKKRVAFQMRLFSEAPSNESDLPTEIQVIPTGEWEHPIWGTMKIDEQTISEFVENWNKGIRKGKVPITAGHSVMEELPAIGWFTELFDRGKQGLYALVEWTDKGKEMLLEGAYKYFSPEYYQVYEDPATLQKYKNVLVGGALTNHPFFRELEDVVAFSEPYIINQFSESNTMNIEEILAKTAEERSEEEVAFLEEKKDDFTDEQTEQLEGETGAEEEEEEEKTPTETPKESAEEEEKKETSAPKGKLITMSETEVTTLREKADQGAEAHAELHKMRVADAVEKMTFSENNAKGKFLPKQKPAVEKFVASLDKTQVDQFTNIVNNMPDAASFSEVGDGGDAEKTTASLLDTKVSELMKENDKLTYSAALKEAIRLNPELENYSEESED